MRHKIDPAVSVANQAPFRSVIAGSYGRTRKELKICTTYDRTSIKSKFVVVDNLLKEINFGTNLDLAVEHYNSLP